MKTCTKCHEDKPSSKFNRQATNKDGHDSSCRACQAISAKAYRKANKEKIATYAKAYYSANKDKLAACSKAYNIANKEKLSTKNKAYRKANKKTELARYKAYREANKEKRADYGRAWRKANPENSKAWRLANPDSGKTCSKAWRKDNPGKWNALKAKRRAAQLLRTPEWSETKEIRQVYVKCSELNDMWETNLQVDHIIPLQGKLVSGLHVHANLQLLDRSLNASKHNSYQI